MLSATSDNCGTSVTVTKTTATENAISHGDCYRAASDGIPTTSCERFEADDDGCGGNEEGNCNTGICSANNSVLPMESIPSSSSSTSSSSGLGSACIIPVESATAPNKEDLGPISRDRCNTWPMRRPQLDINAQTSPLIHEQIPEEETDLCDSVEKLNNGRLGTSSAAPLMGSPESDSFSPGISSPVPCGMNSAGPVGASGTPSDTSDSGVAATNKKSTTRRNAWGNMSYADLITQAIVSSPEKRLTLSQVYEWMVQNVPYFRDKGDSNSSAGWKNSIRHNLSLHSRFMRIQNEGAGKSSWWVINPDAKPGRNPRRQRSATLETTTKVAMDKKRRGARKKVMEMRASGGGGALHSAGSSIVGSQASVLSRELYTGEEDSSNFEPFRSRTQSNLSLSGSSSRVSPSMIENYENFDSFDFPPFVEAASAMPHDILDRTNEMNLNQSDSPAFHRPMANPMLNGTSTPTSSNLITHIKTEPSASRTENNVQPPPSYHELDVVRGIQNIQNPLLRTHLIQNRIPSQHGVPYNGSYSTGSTNIVTPNWVHSNVVPVTIHPSISCAAQQSFSGNTAALPMDLENLALPDQPLMEVENMEAVIRHELSQSAGSQLSFDNI